MWDPVIAVHGGAGALASVRSDVAEQARLRDGLYAALEAGRRTLAAGGAALDAVEEAVRVLEECESFNAGRGSVLNSAGEVEMDAAIMCGATHAAGAVACVRRVVHPIAAARAVLEHTPHVLLAGSAADDFAANAGLALADPSYFVTAARRTQLQRAGERRQEEGGTVGAVALDRAGHLAAATSTGGMTNQARGRIGDSPIVGAGTWAADGRCAVSVTGSGEAILRACAAHEVDAQMRLAGAALHDAAQRALDLVAALGGEAGCVAVAADGAVAMPFRSAAMPRGWVRGGGAARVAIFRDGED